MKDYTTSSPKFSTSIKILETTDPGHADNVNVTTKQLLENTLVLLEIFSEESIKEGFRSVFGEPEEGGSMTSDEIEEAISTEWNGESSEDPSAMTAEQVAEALETRWTGQTSKDPSAMTAEQITDIMMQNI